MTGLPAAAAGIALLCAAFVGWDAVRRPRPERLIWAMAFVVFAVAAATEAVGSAYGWNENLARIYYLAGAVLVVGILALGELYLLLPGRIPALVPGAALLVAAIAATTVWSAPVDLARLSSEGWRAIERGPFLVALAVAINAGGTLVLVGGALLSAWKLRQAGGSPRRAAGCLLIAVGTLVVASGGTLTRFGQPGLLYVAMASGVAIIFAGVLLTRHTANLSSAGEVGRDTALAIGTGARRPRLIPLPGRVLDAPSNSFGEGIRYVAEQLLPRDEAEIVEACRQWSATPFTADALSRAQARQVWALRTALPERARPRFDALPLSAQAQLAELYAEIWSSDAPQATRERRA